MSYCRFGEADVYIYDDVSHGIICCACSMMPLKESDLSQFGVGQKFYINENFVAGYDRDMMLDHIAKHRGRGEFIPTDVDDRLIEERDSS